MVSKTPGLLRVWRVQPWSVNPLMRATDRGEAILRLLTVVTALLLVPIAGAMGTAAYGRATERIQVASATMVEIPAIVTGAPTEHQPAVRYQPVVYRAPARWMWNGTEATGTVEVERTTKAGASVDVWLGPDGRPGDPPKAAGTAVSTGVGTGIAVLLAGWSAALAVIWAAGVALGGIRHRRLDVEWRRFANPIET